MQFKESLCLDMIKFSDYFDDSNLKWLDFLCAIFRDIKPENFMLAKEGDPTCVKMIDFGLSKDFSGQ